MLRQVHFYRKGGKLPFIERSNLRMLRPV
jgi:hypothetical protein